MKPVEQTDFGETTGDCLRACIASILELPVGSVPNFWEQTQSVRKFWMILNKWLSENYGCKCICMELAEGADYLVNGLLCIAGGKTRRGGDHAVVWQDGVIHDPHPSKTGISGKPEYYIFLVPMQPDFHKKEV